MFSSLVSSRLHQRLGVLSVCAAMLLPISPVQAQSNQSKLPNLGDGAEVPLGVERRLGESIAREIYRVCIARWLLGSAFGADFSRQQR